MFLSLLPPFVGCAASTPRACARRYCGVNFVVRGSSQVNTMAVSVRLPSGTGPYIEHYLIQSNNGVLSLESSRFEFDSIPALIDHYAKCCDELPVQLTLPRALREAPNRQQLSSLALLGQEFWRYPMANPKPTSSGPSPTQASSATKSDSSGIGTTVFSTHQQKIITTSHTTIGAVFSPTTPHGIFSQAGTPSDTASSLSSFTSTGLQMMSPESADSVLLTMSPVESTGRNGIFGKTSTFKTQNRKSMDVEKVSTFMGGNLNGSQSSHNININNNMDNGNIRAVRPTPPSTLNLGPLRIPPAPPPRWAKPTTPTSPNDSSSNESREMTNNFTVTTTVTFSVDGNQNQQIMEVLSPNANTTFQTISKRLSPEGECKTSGDTLSSQGSKRWQSQSSKDSSQNHRKILSPHSADTPNGGGGGGRTKRSRSRKESKHYQESDILESPQVYCRSNLGDKISDYEDLWTQDNVINSPLVKGGPLMSSFRPDAVHSKRPDVIAETPIITSLSDNLLSPTGSLVSSNQSGSHGKSPSELSTPTPSDKTPHILSNGNSPHENQELLTPTADINRVQMVELSQVDLQNKNLHQPRNRLGLLLPLTTEVPSPVSDTTPVQTPVQPRSKQGSPFYAEPADALGNVIRRSQRGNPTTQAHRHSEPPKGPIRPPFCQVLSPIESEKSHNISGSLDELKKKNRKSRGRTDPWPVDSSWEFMGNDDQNDYDTDANWKANAPPPKPNDIVILNSNAVNTAKNAQALKNLERLTLNQIIAKRLPDLKIPELMLKTSLPSSVSPESIRRDGKNGSSGKGSRMSSYDNVERGHSGYATTSLICPSSAHSDDGTVFSEPWDSSQWDSFFPHGDDTFSESIHLSKCRPVICNSEDDTIMEESTYGHSRKETHQQHQQPQKVATIGRSRSCRDREILCHPRNKTTTGGPGDTIAAYALSLANERTSTFSRNIENFISCTKESRETSPQIVMRNMRQFMSGMKNYLVKHGEGDFQREVQRARSLLKPDEFLNLDSLLEGVMHTLVVLPLREHLYGLFVDYYTGTGDLQLLVENVKYACTSEAVDFGIRSTIEPPELEAMQKISNHILHLQESELPLAKLEILLSVIAMAIDATKMQVRNQPLGADDFLPLLVYIVAKCGFIGAEIEAEFMWCLLQPSLLNGEAGYYLTALSSATHVLKTFISNVKTQEGNDKSDNRSSALPSCSSVLRVIIPDEYNGSLQTRTLPVRPHTTTKDVCRIIAHKARVTNPQDYGLFKLIDGEETLLMESECPQEVRLEARGKPCMLAYKRIEAKIAWPTTSSIFG